MAEHIGHSSFETSLIVEVLPVVVPEGLLVKVAEEMKGFNAHIRSIDSALQQAPEVFETVGMNPTIDVLDSMVHNLVSVLPRQTLVGEKEVSVEGRTGLNMLLHFGLEGSFLPVRNNGCANLAAALEDAHNSDLIARSASSDAALALGDVHVASLATDERLISLNLTGELYGGIVVQGHADAVKHEPCGLLSDTKGTGHFAGANAVLAIAKNPVSAHPLIQPDRGILENGSDLKAELFLTSGTKPDTAGFDEGMLLRSTTRAANYTVREPQIECVLESTVSVREVDDCLLECVRGFHEPRIGSKALCVKYVIA